MGSEGSKSSCHVSQSCESSETNPLQKGKGSRADDQKVAAHYEHYEFNRKAIFARALDEKAGIETLRIIGEVTTFGILAITRATIGNTNHWAFVMEGTKYAFVKDRHGAYQREKTDVVAYYVVQRGAGDVVSEWRHGTPQSNFHGKVFDDLREAELALCAIEENTYVWKHSDFIETDKAYNIQTLEKLCMSVPSAQQKYGLHNNCQHFALECFNSIE